MLSAKGTFYSKRKDQSIRQRLLCCKEKVDGVSSLPQNESSLPWNMLYELSVFMSHLRDSLGPGCLRFTSPYNRTPEYQVWNWVWEQSSEVPGQFHILKNLTSTGTEVIKCHHTNSLPVTWSRRKAKVSMSEGVFFIFSSSFFFFPSVVLSPATSDVSFPLYLSQDSDLHFK